MTSFRRDMDIGDLWRNIEPKCFQFDKEVRIRWNWLDFSWCRELADEGALWQTYIPRRNLTLHLIFVCFWGPGPFFLKQIRFFMILTCFLSSPTQNHAESFGNHPKKSFLDPKRNIFMKKSSFGHVRTCQGQPGRHVRTCLDLPGPVWTSPGGQVLTANQRKYFFFLQELHLTFFISKFII